MSKELFVKAEEVARELGISKPFDLLSQKVTKARRWRGGKGGID